jgi:methylmalonyl-CoA carboxyltransferase large subunit
MSEAAITREEFNALKEQIAALEAQIRQLQAAMSAAGNSAKTEISEETLHIIAAAVAAYLGKRATIKIVRRVSDEENAWRTQGRVTVAASHRMPRMRGW